MRELFNELDLAGRALRGELIEEIIAERHPSRPKAAEPYCTRTQIINYWTSNRQMVARVHRYLRPDGTIGASGMPDPKMLVAHGVVHECCER